jgi:hypothetical protein
MGNKGDAVDLVDDTGTSGWTKAGSNVTIEKLSYQVWDHTSYATVYVQSVIQVI